MGNYIRKLIRLVSRTDSEEGEVDEVLCKRWGEFGVIMIDSSWPGGPVGELNGVDSTC